MTIGRKPKPVGLVALAASLLVAGLAASRTAHAQDYATSSTTTADEGPRDFRFDLGLTLGGHFFNSEHGLGRAEEDPPEWSPKDNLVWGLRFGIHFNKYFGFEVEGLAIYTPNRAEDFNMWIFQLGGQFIITPVRLGPVEPFLLLGYGAMASVVDENDLVSDDQDGLGRVGLGLKIGFNDRVGLRLEGRLLTPLAFASDLLSLGDETGYGGPDFQALAGLYINLSPRKEKLVVQEKVVVKEAPNPDPDRDGVVGAADRCPDVAEDKDGFEDEDGCPDNDNDKDGIPDAQDKCPLKAESMNGIDDDDGCPEEDTDGDGILGSRDQCPNEPETKNGYKDSDGCPDDVPAEMKKFTGVIQGINFKTNSAVLLRNSFPLLDRAVKVLKDYPDIRLEIQGHTDSRGKADYNRDLSQRRADAVRDYFVKQGIPENRIQAVGYGLDRPIADNRTKTGRSKNRRTEFRIIIEDTPKPAPAGTGTGAADTKTKPATEIPAAPAPAPAPAPKPTP